MSRNSITPRRAFRTIGLSVFTTMPSPTGKGAGGNGLRGLLDLDEAHAAIRGDREPVMEAEPGDLLPRHFSRLQYGEAGRHLDLDTVDGELGHALYSAAIARG